MTLVKLDKSPEATGELESPWCAGENPGVSPLDFDQRACRTSGGSTSGVCGGVRLFTSEVYRSPRRQCEAHGMASDARVASAAYDANDASAIDA